MRLLPFKLSPDEDISLYVFTSACQMVGLCLAVIGILSTDPDPLVQHMSTRPRGLLLTLDTTLFLLATLLSYIALRTRKTRRRFGMEMASEACFSGGMLLMVLIALFLTLELI